MVQNDLNSNRKHPRINAQIPVEFWVRGHTGSRTILTTNQISLGGCMLVGVHDFKPFQIVDLKFIHQNHEVKTKAQILYKFSERGIFFTGAQFIELDLDTTARLKALIGQLM